MAMIVMHSLCFHMGFEPLRGHLRNRFPSLWVSSYARIPDGLFSGSARVRNSIVVAYTKGDAGLRTTGCLRWPAVRRGTLFASLEYLEPPEETMVCGSNPQWPFVDEPTVVAAFADMIEGQRPLSESLQAQGGSLMGFKTTAQYMLGIYTEEPPTVDPDTREPVITSTSQSGWLHFGDETPRDLALVMLAGRWGYLWWLMLGDEFHITKGVLSSFPGGVKHWAGQASDRVPAQSASDAELVRELLELSQELQRQMPQHVAWKLNAGLRVGRYNMLKLRYLTDEADLLLARLWGVEDAFEAAGGLRDRTVFGNRE